MELKETVGRGMRSGSEKETEAAKEIGSAAVAAKRLPQQQRG